MFRSRFRILGLIATMTIGATGLHADWPQWRGTGRDGRTAAPSAAWPKELKEEWQITVGVGHSTPVVSGGRIYVFARQEEQEVLLCLDSKTGKELWRSAQPIAYEMHEAAKGHGKGPKSTPVVSKGNVFTLGISGVLSCHDAQTGKLKWRNEFSKQYPKTSPLFGTAMSPIVDGNVVIAHVGGHDKGALTAFDVETGVVKWANSFDGPAYASPIIVTLAGVRQIVTFTQKSFIGVDASNGQLLWDVPAKSEYDENSATAVSYKDLLIFSREEQGLTAIRLEKDGNKITPREVWANKDSRLYLSSPVLEGNILFGFSALKKGQFFALDADTGKTLWQGPGRTGENAAILNLGGKELLLLTNDAKLIVLPINTKEFAPTVQYTVANSETWAHPVVLDNRILIKDLTTLKSLALR
jgi:outer membrane protein assembly factor BamB